MPFQIQEFEKFPEDDFKALKNSALAFHPFLKWEESLDDAAKAKLGTLKARRTDDYVLRLGVMNKGQLIAASMSFQISSTDLMMAVSMVLPEFRGQGIYTSLCQRTLEAAKQEGFQNVVSKHLLTNNPILIAKLKLGFKICGMEVSAVHGTLLSMTYSFNKQMSEALRYRSGEIFLLSEDDLSENFGTP